MADITMCTSKNCPVRSTCRRQRIEASKNQSWCNFEYTCNENNGFSDYVGIKAKENKNIIKAN